MKTTEAAALLTICAAYDNRKPDPDAAKAWALALGGLRFEDARDAIVKHYQSSREWIMPADVRTEVKRARKGRIDHEVIAIPAGFDPDDTTAYQRLLLEARQAQADGREVEQPEYLATRHIGELRHVLKALPAVEVKPKGATSEHAERLAQARAELENHPARRVPAPPPEPAADEGGAA